MKLALVISLIAGAAAFVPVTNVQQTTALNAVAKGKKAAPVKAKAPVVKKKAPPKKASPVKKGTAVDFSQDFGATLPLGFWDPLGLVADGDQAKFDRLRLVEIKHGRIAMIAVVGYLVQEAGFRWPGAIDLSGLKFADIPNGYAALEAISWFGKLQMFLFIGALEVFVMRDFVGGEFPGDLRNDYIDFGWDTFDADTKLRKRAIELNQGRAAQMGILALMVHEQLGVSLIPATATMDYSF